jgi:hypothetical protein
MASNRACFTKDNICTHVSDEHIVAPINQLDHFPVRHFGRLLQILDIYILLT